MVQALAVHSKQDAGHNRLQKLNKGTGAEYNFYQTLSIMLQQVLSNPDNNGQKSELQMIYQWFTLNKPLAPQRVKPNAQRPKITFSSRRSFLLSDRPQTAPAVLYTHYSSSKTPVCPPSTPALTSFTSSYIARTVKTPELITRPATQPLPVRTDWLVDDGGSGHQVTPSKSNLDKTASGITTEAILANASSVAAQMTVDRFMANMDKSTTLSLSCKMADNKTLPALPVMHDDEHTQRHRTQSTERSKSLTTLETISEADNETEWPICDEKRINDCQNIVSTNHNSSICEQKEIQDEREKGLRPSDKPPLVKEESTKVSPAQDRLTEVPKVIIENRKLKPRRSATSSLSSAGTRKLLVGGDLRKAYQLQVITLDLQTTPENNMKKRKEPKKLVSIVAGFNQHHYRPRTIAL